MAGVDHYRHTLEELGRQPGTLALIFGKAQNKFQDPAKLRRVIGVPPALDASRG